MGSKNNPARSNLETESDVRKAHAKNREENKGLHSAHHNLSGPAGNMAGLPKKGGPSADRRDQRGK